MRTVDLPADFDRTRDEIECQLHAVKARGAKAELLEVDDPHSLEGPRLVQAMDAVRDVRDRTMREIGAGLMNPQLLREDRAVEAWMRLRSTPWRSTPSTLPESTEPWGLVSRPATCDGARSVVDRLPTSLSSSSGRNVLRLVSRPTTTF